MHKYNALDSPLLRVSRPVAACSRCKNHLLVPVGRLTNLTCRPSCEDQGRVIISITDVEIDDFSVTASSQHVLHARRRGAKVNAQVPMISSPRGRREGMLLTHLRHHESLNLTRFSYVASLESRVEKLERRIQYARSRKASVAMHDGEFVEPPDRKDSLATIRAAIHGKAARRREATEVNELVSDFGFLSVCPRFPRTPSYTIQVCQRHGS